MGRVVVGVDGSGGGRRALEFALDEARRRGAPLEVVHVAAPPRPGMTTPGMASEFASEGTIRAAAEREGAEARSQLDHARQRAEQLLGRMIAEAQVSDVEVTETVLMDRRPARRLVELVNADDDVDMLIVGSRGQGELTGLLLGSVSQACVSNARVPVTVVPPER